MDPLTALGLASNIVQFVDFTSKLISSTRKLYFSSSGAKEEHLELESLAQNIRELAERAKPGDIPKGNLSIEDNTLLDLSNYCVKLSDELLPVLESLKVKGDHRGWDSFYQALEASGRRTASICFSKGLIGLAVVTSTLHKLAAENRRLEVSRTKDIDDLRQGFKTIFKQIQVELKEEGAKNRGTFTQLSLAAERGLEYSSEQAILEFIRFDAIEDRQIAVRKAHHKTFSWIFRSSISASQSQRSANFGEWLTSDHSLFWVSGRPGSGKSTLMKYICEHKDTRTNLEVWARGHKLIVANFFFWNAGRQDLQKSQEGLLRSILYQILRQSPNLIPYASPGLWRKYLGPPGNRIPFAEDLTTTKLLTAFQSISAHLATSKVKFCFFIDGLDEYEGRPHDIIRLVELLKSTLQVKVCVSSRPWNEFEKAFGQDLSNKLYMQDLTRGDIELYVRDTLESDIGFQELKQRDNRCLDLVRDVVEAANGVFLWVFLVIRSLLEGLTNDDRIVDLQRRLRLLPTDLNEYFERILFTVDNFYRKQTAQMFQVTLMARGTLPLICYWFIDQEDPTLFGKLNMGSFSQEVIDRRLLQMQKRLNACCKGLLEAQFIDLRRFDPNLTRQQDNFFFLRVDFLHRTVRDFLRVPDMQNMVNKWVGAGFEANVAICEAILCQVKTTPQVAVSFRTGGPVASLLDTLFYHIEILENKQYPVATEARLLDELDGALRKHGSAVVEAKSMLSSSRLGERSFSSTHVSVLEEAVHKGLQRYVSMKLDEQSNLTPAMRSDLLLAALLRSAHRSNPDPRVRMVPLLLERGFDPNILCTLAPLGTDLTVWAFFLQNEYADLQKGTNMDFDATYTIIKELLQHGVDVNAICPVGPAVGREVAASVVRMLVTRDDARELEPLLNPVPKQPLTHGTSERRRRDFVKSIFWWKHGKGN